MIHISLNAHSTDDYKQWHEEQVIEAANQRLLSQVMRERMHTPGKRGKMLAWIGRKIVSIGDNLVQHSGDPMQGTEQSRIEGSDTVQVYHGGDYEIT